MNFDFESIIDRKGKDSLAIDLIDDKECLYSKCENDDPITMWVADMNFKTCERIVESIRNRLDHPLFGYYKVSDDYYNAIINWQTKRNGYSGLTKEMIGYENGVLGGLATTLRALIQKNDSVLINSPTYIGFTKVLNEVGYNIVSSELVKDENGIYRLDIADMDKKIKENNIKVIIFCSPHNPTGRVFSKDEVKELVELAINNNCNIISDEIWSDIILNGNKHTPTLMASPAAKDIVISLYAPSKTFNLAGLIGSYHIIMNKDLRDRIEKASSETFYNEMNVLSMHALIGAYSDIGMMWNDELKQVLSNNVNYFVNELKKYDDIIVTKPEGTYMLFVDFSKYLKKHNITLDEVLLRGIKNGVLYQDGRPFKSEYSIRINLASPYMRIKDAMERIKKYVLID